MKTFVRSLTVALAGASLLLPSFVAACPLCPAPSLTLSEQAGQADGFLVAEWKDGTKDTSGDGEETASTTFEVKRVLKGTLKPGETIKMAGFNPGKAGDLFLLSG